MNRSIASLANKVKYIFVLIMLATLTGCMTLQEMAERHCKQDSDRDICVANYIERSNRVRAVVEKCVSVADEQTSIERRLKDLDCSGSGYINKGYFYGSQSCTPRFESCKDLRLWDIAFKRCMNSHDSNIEDNHDIDVKLYYDLMRTKNSCR